MLTISSRKDNFLGDQNAFDASVFNQTKAVWAGLETIDLETSAKARALALRNSVATNPEFKLSPLAWAFIVGESSAPLMVFGDAVAGTAPRASVDFFFGGSLFCPNEPVMMIYGRQDAISLTKC